MDVDPLLLLAPIRALLRAVGVIAAWPEPVQGREEIIENVPVTQATALFAAAGKTELFTGCQPDREQIVRCTVSRPRRGLLTSLHRHAAPMPRFIQAMDETWAGTRLNGRF